MHWLPIKNVSFCNCYKSWKKHISFDSNFNCKCQTTVSDPNNPTYTLIYESVNTSERPEYNYVDVTDINLEKTTILSNFKYYQNLDFHKLAKKQIEKKNL